MSKAINSPTARILRSSRWFCMPPPLPQPSVDVLTNQGSVRTSDTATLPYPSLQAITAPASSRHRGDWGLKRPLPEKTNRTSNPHVRINAMDTLEHITDFDSAADHTLTLRKAQEMNVWMTQPLQDTKKQLPRHVSAFDDNLDHTVIQDPVRTNASTRDINGLGLTSERAIRIREINRVWQEQGRKPSRWKTEGPYLPTMSEVDFEKYLQTIVSSPKIRQEFRKFLLQVTTDKKRRQSEESMREQSGFDPDNAEDVARLDELTRVQDAQKEVDEFMLHLRQYNDTLASELPALIQQFFDLPPLPVLAPGDDIGKFFKRQVHHPRHVAPPAAHPSAGLSYIRTSSHMENHPAHGPQLYQSPIQARVLRPRNVMQGPAEKAMLGVGGFAVVDKTDHGHMNNDLESNDFKGSRWNFDTPGGNKLWVVPERAYVDDNARIRLSVAYPDKEAVAVKTGGPDPRTPAVDENDSPLQARLKQMSVSSDSQYTNDAPPGTAANANFGSAMPDLRPTPRAKGFEGDELKAFKGALKQAADEPNGQLGPAILRLLSKTDNRSSA
ncbi:hypothetical protein CAC42_6433 [Sphaceloma murrayae]|uniref:Uncharacterized protein n=1 Tax=Sphaceloma murrayae TaxID=2082308 RepID=A0A2K1QMF0_9PEZI|nr:hypothetical protein CAC42_6433 [Sphaceloma murrayae]